MSSNAHGTASGQGGVGCASTLSLTALPGFPRVAPGDDVASLIVASLERARMTLQTGDVLVVTSKVFSRAEGRFVDLARVTPGARAVELARAVGKDARMVELILRESSEVSRTAPNVIIVRHRLGFVSANAGIDLSNALPGHQTDPGTGPWALLLPENPDACARRTRDILQAHYDVPVGVVVSDSHGRPFRLGTVGIALGVSGLPALHNQIGRSDLDGRKLESTLTAPADQVAAAADLVAGQADEARPVILVRGLEFAITESSAAELLRTPDQDLYV
jgi:coenzyme F420-0:L-glutamate ligase/coenzyme F420-1:gamma-L-glutamate ligase